MVDKYQIVRNDWNGFNILHNHSSMVGALDIGFSGCNAAEILQKSEEGLIKFIYLLGCDEVDMSKLKSSFVVYQGHHGDVGASYADIILPSPAYTEQDGIYVNLEGRPQYAIGSVAPVGQAQEDWLIIKNLADNLGIDLGIHSLTAVRERLVTDFPIFTNIGSITKNNFTKFISMGRLLKEDIITKPINYYMTDSISRASVTMAKCLEAKIDRDKKGPEAA